VRQNTRALRAQSRQQIVQGYRQYNEHFIRDPSLDEVIAAGLRGYPDVDNAVARAFFNLMLDHVVFFQATLALFESGSLDEETFSAFRDHLAAQLATPGGAAFWEHTKSGLPSHVVRSLDERISKSDLPDFLDHPALNLHDPGAAV